MRERLSLLQDVDQYAGKYFSEAWIRKTVLMQSEEDIETMDGEMQEEGAGEEDGDDLE